MAWGLLALMLANRAVWATEGTW